MCDTNKNVTNIGVIIKGVYSLSLSPKWLAWCQGTQHQCEHTFKYQELPAQEWGIPPQISDSCQIEPKCGIEIKSLLFCNKASPKKKANVKGTKAVFLETKWPKVVILEDCIFFCEIAIFLKNGPKFSHYAFLFFFGG